MKKILMMGVVVMLLCSASIAGAENTYWIGGTGDWSSSNWMFTVPTSVDEAYINNGGTVNINGGTAEAAYVWVGSSGGVASTIDHSAGSANFGGALISRGSYNLSGSGSLSGGTIRVWDNFDHSGGTNNLSTINVNSGIYSLSGSGQINSNLVELIDFSTFIQTGGINNSQKLTVQQPYIQHVPTYDYNLNGGVLNAQEQIIAPSHFGAFNHTAGTNTADSLHVGEGGNGFYYLSGTGEVSVNSEQVIGYAGNGIMEQSGGTNEIASRLVLGRETGSSGIYDISGGTLSADVLQVGYFGSGDFQINDSSAYISVTNSLFFSTDSSISAVSGSTINMDGASLENWNTDQFDLWGFNNLEMAFNGGTGTSLLEVAGSDVGSVWSGSGLFAFDTLSLTSTADVQLVNNRTNMGGAEALYANNCVFSAGSILDLNGINLYCNNITDNGATITYNGGELVKAVVPEPISSTLFVIGGATLGFRHFRRKFRK